MLYDGLNLVNGSSANNVIIETGTTLPSTNLLTGRIFFLTAAYSTYTVGFYAYDGTEWKTGDISGIGAGAGLSGGGSAGEVSLSLATSGVTAGTYTKVVVDSYGRVTDASTLLAADVPNIDASKITSGTIDTARLGSGTADNTTYLRGDGTWQVVVSGGGSTDWGDVTNTPTTLAGYGIVDAQALDADLTAIAGLVGTSGLLKKTATDTWTLDTNTYLTGNESITLSGDASGTGTTAITVTLANSGVTSGSYGSATGVATFTVDSKGRLTAAGTTAIQSSSTSQSGIVQLNDTVSSTSTTEAATANAVKQAYDAATGGLQTTGGTMTGDLTLANDPTLALHAATKQYVDNSITGLDMKESVRVATTANITLSGTQTIDDISVIADDRVLVKDQSTGSQNGIYVVAAGAWTRATDADESAEVTSGMYCFVEEGTANADSGWVLATDGAITLDTTSLSFTQFNGLGQVTAGTGLTKVGSEISLESGVAAPGTYKSVTVDTYGRVTAGTNPTTLSGYGITDAQPLDGDLTSIAGLAGTSGILTKTAADTWTLDTSTYLTGNQSITLSGDATGSGTTAITVTLANSGVTAGTYTKTTVDAKGRVTAGTTLSASDIPNLDASKITTGTIGTARLGSGTADSTTYLRGDNTWQTIAAGGASVTDDTTTNSTFYPTFADGTSGSVNLKVSSTKLQMNPSTGEFSATEFNALSDRNYKENIEPLDSMMDLIMQLNPVSFTWKDSGKESLGVIAQELEQFLPMLVTTTDEGRKTVNYNGLIAVLIKVIQELITDRK